MTAKLRSLVPWSEHSRAYQHAFIEAYRLCQQGYDFNLISQQAQGYFAQRFVRQASTHARGQTVTGRFTYRKRRRRWRDRDIRKEEALRRQGVIEMVPAGQMWVQERPERYAIVREGILNRVRLDALRHIYLRQTTVGRFKSLWTTIWRPIFPERGVARIGRWRQRPVSDDHVVAQRRSRTTSDTEQSKIPEEPHHAPRKSLQDFVNEHTDERQAMAAAYLSGLYSIKAIALYFGVPHSTVSQAVKDAALGSSG